MERERVGPYTSVKRDGRTYRLPFPGGHFLPRDLGMWDPSLYYELLAENAVTDSLSVL
jgi:hypothetical protein